MSELVTPVTKTSTDLVNAKKRATEVMAKLGNLRTTLAAAAVATGNQPNLRDEVARMRENVQKFKQIIADASKVAVASSDTSGSFASMRRNKVMDDPTRSLLERIGGDLCVETALELVYNKALQDPRLRAFFEKNVRKIQQIRKRMQDFLTGFLGGHKLYDDANLKPVHYHMNITDYHVDAMLENFALTFQEMGVHPDAAADALSHISKVRKDLTTGCTVRMEMARKSVERGKDALFKNIGGEAGMQKFIDRVYDLIAVDARLKKFFQGKNVVAIKESQRVFLTEAVGGPAIYKGRALEEVHKNMGVDDYFFDCFMMDCEKALSGLGLDDQTIDEVLVVIEPIRAAVIGRHRGVAAAAGGAGGKGKLVDGKTILERLGGEMNLEAIMETAHNGFLLDPRIKFFFCDKPIPKQAEFKRKFAAAIAVTIGAPATLFDISKLREFHYDMNITSYAFDAVLENFTTACELMDVERPVVLDFTEAIQKFRSDITAGCTVRLELATKKTETAGTDNLFGVLGRKDGVKKVIQRVYKYVADDARISHFFRGSKLDALMESQGKFLAELFGSNEVYEGRELERVHAMINVSDFHFDCFIETVVRSLKELGSDPSTADECTVLLETVRLMVVNPALRKHNTRKAQEQASRRTLFDRIGGEPAFMKLAELVYDKAMIDDRLKSFFEKNKAKVQSIKKKLGQFMAKLAGGSSSYDPADMRPAHYGMNITDWHFDTMLELVQTVLATDLGAKKGDIREFARKMQAVRQDVTTGCTVRTDVAKNNLGKGKDQLFIKMGKAEGIAKHIDQLFEVILSDPRIRHLFEKADANRLKKSHGNYMMEVLGGPNSYKGANLTAAHKALGLTDYHFDSFLNDLSRALLGAGKPEALIDEVLITIEPLRAEVLGRDTSASSLPGVMRDGKCLMERVGGDMAVESLIDSAYDKACEDPRIKYFFDKPKQKIRQIKQRMYQYISGAYGGPVQYDATQLKGVHTNMNLTDYHFDSFLENFVVSAKEMNLDNDSLDDAMTVMNRVRTDVTTGCTVRMELARKRIEVAGLPKLYESLGSKEGLDNILISLWEVVDRDKRVCGYFEGAKSKLVKSGISNYLITTLGGPGKYTGRPLDEIHQTINVNDHHFDCFIQGLQRAVRDAGMSNEVVDEAVVSVEALRKKVLNTVYSKLQ